MLNWVAIHWIDAEQMILDGLKAIYNSLGDVISVREKTDDGLLTPN